MKTALLQCPDSGPIESLVIMLASVGYRCVLPDRALLSVLSQAGCDVVAAHEDLVRNWGYERVNLQFVGRDGMDSCDLFIDIKAQRNAPKVLAAWPRLRGKLLWYRINGGKPEHVVNSRGDMGDEVNPPCPVITPNLWYRDPGPWSDMAYAMWPPFARFTDYGKRGPAWETPVCLVHNFKGWGYGLLGDICRERFGLRIFGRGSPEGLIDHSHMPLILQDALAMIHLKSSDAPGYALYEGLAAACPMIVPRRLIWRNRMEELFIPNETCFVFDRETHDALTPHTAEECAAEIDLALKLLRDPKCSERIGEAGRARLSDLMWREDRDGASLCEFMQRFGW